MGKKEPDDKRLTRHAEEIIRGAWTTGGRQ